MTIILDYISGLSILAPVIVGAIFYFRLFAFAQILYWFVLFTLLCEVIALVLMYQSMNNMFVFHLFSFGEVSFICLIYTSLSDNVRFRKMIVSGFIIFQSLSLVNLLFFDSITHFNSVQRYFEMAIIYTLLSTYIYRAMNEKYRYPLLKDSSVLLTLGFMVYYLFTFLLFVQGKEILIGEIKVEWIIHSISNVLLNAVFAVVLFKSRLAAH